MSIPDVKQNVFVHLLEYLYTDSIIISQVLSDIGMQILELANRLCLTRLVNYMENAMINDFTQKQNLGIDVMESCIHILEPAQVGY